MNILFDKWLPVEAPDGTVVKISPAELPGSSYVGVAHPRSDFSALATELLVCLFQTACAPANPQECEALVEQRKIPKVETLEYLREAFELSGEGSRFLQVARYDGNDVPSFSLLFDAPGAQTLKYNKDLFTAREAEGPVCAHCAPIALFLNQAHARQAGQGYRSGPRGASAMTALIEADTLWKTVCLNLLPSTWFDRQVGGSVADDVAALPWLNSTALNKKESQALGTFGRFGVLWWMPVSVRLHFTKNTAQVPCSICGEIHAEHSTRMSRRPTPAQIAGRVRHPHAGWEPHKESMRAIEVPKNSFNVGHWFALTQGQTLEDSLPALRALPWYEADHVRLRVFGFCMNKSSAIFWLDETAPVLQASDETSRETFKQNAKLLMETAERGATSLRAALYYDKDKAIDNAGLPLVTTQAQAERRLWDTLNKKAWAILSRCRDQALTVDELAQFQALVRREALNGFDRAVPDVGDNPLVTKAILSRRSNLLKKLSPKK